MPALGLKLREKKPVAKQALETKPYRLEHVATPTGSAYDFTWSGARSYIAWHDIVLEDGEMRGDDLAHTHVKDMRDLLTFFPKGVRAEGWCDQAARPNAFTALYFDEDWVLDQFEIPDRARGFGPQVYFRNPTLLGLMNRLTAFATNPGAGAQLLIDSVALTAAAEILRVNAERPSRGQLSPTQLANAQDFIQGHLCDDISLEQIAAAVGLSTFHFARAFKQSTGQSPHRFVLERRLDRAKRLMASTDLPLGEIAIESGFSDLSHFSRTFSEMVGETARTFRARAR